MDDSPSRTPEGLKPAGRSPITRSRRSIMKKTRLDIRNLEVDSFDTLSIPTERGTVQAHYGTKPGYSVHQHSCVMTGEYCHCNYTDGACTWGADETCAGDDPPCPV
jgi:hypothetical protein